MSVAKVLKLGEHRDRRRYRLAMARAMLKRDRSRRALLEHLAEIAELSGSDRVAAVWIDEYGPGIVHPHLVLDLLSDRPRRLFSTEPLRKAWDVGVPGALDDVSRGGGTSAATFAVALGSDGARGWFLVADSVTRTTCVDTEQRDRIMFLAGECSAIVLHRDLDASEGREGSFTGWRFLKDLEGHDGDERRSGVVGRRFEVGRLFAGLVEEDLHVPDERRQELAERTRESVESDEGLEDDEASLLDDMIHAYEAGELTTMATVSLEAAQAAERLDHVSGAFELYSCSYEISVALGEAPTSIEAARSIGRILRRRGLWQEADRWYQTALEIAERAELWGLTARARLGLAVIQKDLGNLDSARERMSGALDAASTANDSEAAASVYHDLMNLEHVAGDLPLAARHGWRAINTFVTDEGRSRCLVGFAWVLKELGDLEAAEDAYAVARETADDSYYRLYAYDGFSHMAALRGDVAAFDERAAECDALGWEEGPATAKAEILYYRGVSHGLLGRPGRARLWLERAAAFAEEHSLEVVRRKAQTALTDLPGGRPETRASAPREVREGLRAMRNEILGTRSA